MATAQSYATTHGQALGAADRSRYDRLATVALALAFVLPVVYFCTALRWPARIASDSAIGFLTWDSMMRGGPWNHWTPPDLADLTRNQSSFTSWWSPGQYMVTSPFELLGLNLGQAMALSTLLIEWIGLSGFLLLFRSFGFDRISRCLAIAFIAIGSSGSGMFNYYLGGENALFGFFPWAIYFAWRSRSNLPIQVVSLVAIFLFGTFLKLSFQVTALGITLFCFVEACGWRPRFAVRTLVVGAALGAAFIGAFGIFSALYLNHGASPNAVNGGQQGLNFSLAFPFCGTFLSAFSFTSLLGRIFLYPSHPLLDSLDQLGPWIWVAVPVACASYWIAVRQAPASSYRNALCSMLLAFTAAFTFFYLRGNAIGFDERHFRLPSYLLIPGLVAALFGPGRITRKWLLSLFAFATAYGVATYIQHSRNLASQCYVGTRGFSHSNISAGALRALDRIDASDLDRRTVVYTPSLEQSLEIRHLRAMPGLGLLPTAATFEGVQFRGRAVLTVVFYPDSYGLDGNDTRLLGCFKDIPQTEWRRESVDGWEICYDRPAAAPVVRAAVRP